MSKWYQELSVYISPYHAIITLSSCHIFFAPALASLPAAHLRYGAISVTLTRCEKKNKKQKQHVWGQLPPMSVDTWADTISAMNIYQQGKEWAFSSADKSPDVFSCL